MPRFVIQTHDATSLHYDFRLEASGAEGEKLRGGWSLRHIGEERWLLIKKRDEQADARRNPVSTQPESVKSGTTIEELGD